MEKPNFFYADPDTGKVFRFSRADINFDILLPTRQTAWLVGEWIKEKTGIDTVVTSAKRTLVEQINAMTALKKRFGEKYYNDTYKRQGQDPATLPHVEGRAVDLRFIAQAIPFIQELNGIYLKGALKAIGVVPSRLIVVENGNCLHVQIPRLKSYGNYIYYIQQLVGKCPAQCHIQ